MNFPIIASSFISAMLGAMGIGGGTVLIIYLTSFLSLEQKSAQGINLIFFLITGLIGIARNLKNKLVDKSTLKELLIYSLPGLFAGYILLNFIPTEALRRLFAYVLLFIGLKTLFSKKESKHPSQ